MIIKTHKDIPSSEITPPEIFQARRKFVKMLGLTLASANIPSAFASEQKLNFANLVKSTTPNDDLSTCFKSIDSVKIASLQIGYFQL
jgi:hypothetical protein